MSIFGVRLRVLIPLRPASSCYPFLKMGLLLKWPWAAADACKDPLVMTANHCSARRKITVMLLAAITMTCCGGACCSYFSEQGWPLSCPGPQSVLLRQSSKRLFAPVCEGVWGQVHPFCTFCTISAALGSTALVEEQITVIRRCVLSMSRSKETQHVAAGKVVAFHV